VSLTTPRGVGRINVKSALNMQKTLNVLSQTATVFISAAAVADWRPAESANEKIKKDGSGRVPTLSFVENPDILAGIASGARAQNQQLFCVGFAAESHDLLANAQAKRERKGVPLLVGNIGPDTFGQDDNALLLVDAQGTTDLPKASKLQLARQLVAEIALRLPT
jgi:phosphopantothenoylcysteine decarboxylase/phosphopantothenate--cysteine ligase